ncbi:MAG: hypothetical protein AAF702_05610 [Chloroflexota bacterium]
MLDPYIGKAAFQLGFYIAFVAGVLLLFLEQGTAEYVITQFTLAIGVTFIVIIGILVRVGGSDK